VSAGFRFRLVPHALRNTHRYLSVSESICGSHAVRE
jgi:hypothetical protein